VRAARAPPRAGAYAGKNAEELGQGEAIAVNLREMFGFRVPIISVVIGEGGSGGALAIGCANRNLIMEHSVYYVASPEACAAILWKSRDKAATVRTKPCAARCMSSASAISTIALVRPALAGACGSVCDAGSALAASSLALQPVNGTAQKDGVLYCVLSKDLLVAKDSALQKGTPHPENSSDLCGEKKASMASCR
jgi:hypothetical protein